MSKNEKIAITLIFLSTFVSRARSQYFAADVDMISLYNGLLNISFETSINERFSAALFYENGNYEEGTSGTISSQNTVYTVDGFVIGSEFRYYPFHRKPAPAGLFLGAHGSYMKLTETFTDQVEINNEGSAFNYGPSLGCKWNAGFFILEALGGFYVPSGSWENEEEHDKIDGFFRTNILDDIRPRIEFSIGIMIPNMSNKV